MSRPSCLKCSKYLSCREEQKGPRFHCSNFVKLREIGHIGELQNLLLSPDPRLADANVNLDLPEKKVLEIDLAPGVRHTVVLSDSVTPIESGTDKLPEDFVWQAMQNAFDPLTNTVRDLKIDDSDLARAKNYFDFCDNVAGRSIKTPFSRQLWIAATLLNEWCPDCTRPEFHDITNVPVDADTRDLVSTRHKHFVLLENGVCPHCGVTRAHLIRTGRLYDINQLVLVAGQRAGKSAFTSTVAAHHTHLMLKAPRLSSICPGIQDFSPLTGTFVALTATRAIKLLWNPFSQLINNSEWFDSYFDLLDSTGRSMGKELFKKGDLYMRFFHKNLDYYPMGPLKRTLRGDTRILAATDEIGWFPYRDTSLQTDDEGNELESEEEDEREHANGDEVHQSLDNSLSTVRSEVWALYKKNISSVPTGLNLNISSPQAWKDKICRLLKDSEDPKALSLGVRLATWELNPFYTRDHPIIVSAYSKNMRRAERDFGANPPRLSANVFSREAVKQSFTGKATHAILYDEDVPEYTVGKLINLFEKAKWDPAVLGLDAGLSNNGFSMVFTSRDDQEIDVPCVIELVPRTGRPINFPLLYKNILLPLVKACNIVYVGADRWNSIHMLQQLEEDTKGRCKYLQIALTARHYASFVELVNSGHLTLPKLTMDFDRIEAVTNYKVDLLKFPAEHLYLQFLTSKMSNDVLMKGDGYTDDLLRALIVSTTLHFIPKVRDYVAEHRPVDRAGTSGRAVTIVRGRSMIPRHHQ